MERDYTENGAWGALCLFGTPRPFIHDNAVRSTRAAVQEYIGEAWAHSGETWRQGWRRAYRAGWRAIRVSITPWSMEIKKLDLDKDHPND